MTGRAFIWDSHYVLQGEREGGATFFREEASNEFRNISGDGGLQKYVAEKCEMFKMSILSKNNLKSFRNGIFVTFPPNRVIM